MKPFLSLIFLALLTLSTPINAASADTTAESAPAQPDEENLTENKIYFFAHSMCQNCKEAYIYFSTYHQSLDIPIIDMKYKHNLELYKQCVKKFDIKNSELTLPLICLGNHYLMGWDNTSPALFEKALKSYQEEALEQN